MNRPNFPVIYANAITGQAGFTPELGPDLQAAVRGDPTVTSRPRV